MRILFEEIWLSVKWLKPSHKNQMILSETADTFVVLKNIIDRRSFAYFSRFVCCLLQQNRRRNPWYGHGNLITIYIQQRPVVCAHLRALPCFVMALLRCRCRGSRTF